MHFVQIHFDSTVYSSYRASILDYPCCPGCGHILDTDDIEIEYEYVGTGTKYTINYAQKVNIYCIHCPYCNCTIDYDGLFDGLININNKSLVTHELFNRYTILRCSSTMSLSCFIKSIQSSYYQHCPDIPFLSYPSFKKFHDFFIDIQNWTNKITCYGCIQKNQLPKIIGADATSLLLKKKHVTDIITPKHSHEVCHEKVYCNMKNWRPSDVRLVYIDQRKDRMLCLRYISNNIGTLKTDSSLKPLNANQIHSLFSKLIINAKTAPFGNFLKYIHTKLHDIKPHKYLLLNINHFVRAVSNYIPIDSIIHTSIHDLCSSIRHEIEVDFKQVQSHLSDNFPILSNIITLARKKTINLSNHFYDLIEQLGGLASQVQKERHDARVAQPQIEKATDIHQTLFKNPKINGTHYGFDAKALRPIYDYASEAKNDNNSQDIDLVDALNDESTQVGNCNKYYAEYSKMSNGLVVFRCLEHGYVFGSHVLRDPESENEYFSLMLMIYGGQEGPDFVVCDTACQLDRYCKNREPLLFKKTKFINDELHATGHKCGAIYNIKYYKHSNERISRINDSAIEQTNATLSRIKTAAYWMNLNTLTRFLDLIIEINNRKLCRIKKRLPIF